MEDIFFNTEEEYNNFLADSQKFVLNSLEDKENVYYKDGMVIKKIINDHHFYGKNPLVFKDLNIPHVYFAKAGVYVNNCLRALIMVYAQGITIYNSLYDVNIDLLINSFKDLEITLNSLLENRIRTDDIHSNNILFDGRNFNFIDTIGYYRSSMPFDKIDILNRKEVLNVIFESVLPPYLYGYLYRRGFINDNWLNNNSLIILNKIMYKLQKNIGNYDTFNIASEMIRKRGLI